MHNIVMADKLCQYFILSYNINIKIYICVYVILVWLQTASAHADVFSFWYESNN